MSTSSIDYSALAQQAGAVSSTPPPQATTPSGPAGGAGGSWDDTQAPVDYAALAQQAGAVSSMAPPAPKWGENIDRPGYKPGYFETLYAHGYGTVKKLAGQAWNDASNEVGLLTGNPADQQAAQQREDAEEAKKLEVYHKVASDFHDAIAKHDVGKIIDAAGDFSSLFQNPVNPDDPVATLADSYVSGAKHAYAQAGIHAENIANTLDDAAEKYQRGDKAGALSSLQSLPKDSFDLVRNAATTALSIGAPGASAFTAQIVNQAADEWEQGKKAEGLADLTLATTPKLKEIRESGVGDAVHSAVTQAADAAYKSGLGDALAKLGVEKPELPNISDTVNNAANAVGQRIPGAIKTTAQGVGYVGAKVAIPAATGLASGIAGALLESAKDSLDTLSNAATAKGSEVLDAMKDIRDKASQTLADKGITGEAATNAVNDLMGRIQDEYKYWQGGATNPATGEPGGPVSGGSGEEVPEGTAASGPVSTFKSWISDLTDRLNNTVPIPEGATSIARAAAVDIANAAPGEKTLADVATPSQMAGGGLLDVEKALRKTGDDLGQHIATTYDAPAREVANAALDRAINRISPETAGMSQSDRIARLESTFNGTPSIDMARPGSPEFYQQATQALLNAEDRTRIFGRGTGDPTSSFARLQRLPDAEFNRIIARNPEVSGPIRQGLVRYLADTTKDPTTGAYHLGKMQQLIDENAVKLGSDYAGGAQFKTLGDGLAELDRQMNMSNTKARSLLATTIGGGVMLGLDVLFAHADPLRAGALLGSEYLLWKFGAPALTDLLMKPRNVNDINLLFRIASKTPEGSYDQALKKAGGVATRVQKNVTNKLVDYMKQSFQPGGIGDRLINGEKGEAGLPGTIFEGNEVRPTTGKTLQMPEPPKPIPPMGPVEGLLHRGAQAIEDWLLTRDLNKARIEAGREPLPGKPLGKDNLIEGGISSTRNAVKQSFPKGGAMNPPEAPDNRAQAATELGKMIQEMKSSTIPSRNLVGSAMNEGPIRSSAERLLHMTNKPSIRYGDVEQTGYLENKLGQMVNAGATKDDLQQTAQDYIDELFKTNTLRK